MRLLQNLPVASSRRCRSCRSFPHRDIAARWTKAVVSKRAANGEGAVALFRVAISLLHLRGFAVAGTSLGPSKLHSDLAAH